MALNQRSFASSTATPRREGSSSGQSYRLNIGGNGSPAGSDSRWTATSDSGQSHQGHNSLHGHGGHQHHHLHHHHHDYPSHSEGSASASNRTNGDQSSADEGALVGGQPRASPPPPQQPLQPLLQNQQPTAPVPPTLHKLVQQNVQAAAPNDNNHIHIEVAAEFSEKCAKVLTILVGIVFTLLSLLACIIGFNSMYQCPASPFIPVCLSGGGITCLIFVISIIIGELCSWRINFSAFKILMIILIAFIAFWLIGGSIATFNPKLTTDPLVPMPYRSRYCDKTAYEFSMFILCFIHINLIALFIFLIVCAFVVNERMMRKLVGIPLQLFFKTITNLDNVFSNFFYFLFKDTAVQKSKSKSKLMATNKSGVSTGPSSKSASKATGKFPTMKSSSTASSSRSHLEKVAFAPGDAPPTFIGGMLEPTVVPANPLMHPAPPDPEKTTVPTENSEPLEPSINVPSDISKAKSTAASSAKSTAAPSSSKAPSTMKSKKVPARKTLATSSKATPSVAPTETSTTAATSTAASTTAAASTAAPTTAAASEKTVADLSALAPEAETMGGATTAISEQKANETEKSFRRKKAKKSKKSTKKASNKEVSSKEIAVKSAEKKSPIVQAVQSALPAPDLSVQTDRRKLTKTDKSAHYKIGIDVKTQPIPKVPKDEKAVQHTSRKVGDPKNALPKASKFNDKVPKQVDIGDVKATGVKSAAPQSGKATPAPKKTGAADATSAAGKLKSASAVGGGAKEGTFKLGGKPSTGETVLVTSAIAGDMERVAPPEQQNSRRKCIICTATIVGILLVAICVAAAVVVSRMGGGAVVSDTTTGVGDLTTIGAGGDDAAAGNDTAPASGDSDDT